MDSCSLRSDLFPNRPDFALPALLLGHGARSTPSSRLGITNSDSADSRTDFWQSVYAAVRDPKSAEALVAAHGDRVVPLRLDLADADSILAAAAAAPDVAIVVNNGGVLTTTGPLDDAVFDSLEYEMEVNVRGLLRVARAFAPVLKA